MSAAPTSRSSDSYSTAPFPGAGALRRPLPSIEIATLVHVGVLLLLASWGFGGNAPGSRLALSCWGSLAILISVAALRAQENRRSLRRPLRWLWPLGLFNAVVIASAWNPSFREITMDGELLLVGTDTLNRWPSTARPALTLKSLWLFDAVFLSCFNVVLILRQRRALRGLLLFAGVNTLALAVFGTVQKLIGSPGLYFGAVPSPQEHFFSSFIYHNHWGAFALLMVAACLGLTAYYAARGGHRDFWHSPALLGLVVVFLIAITIPLSTSRSSTLLVLALLLAALAHGTMRTVRTRRAAGKSAVAPLVGGLGGTLIAFAAGYFLAQPVIEQRIAKTKTQVAEMMTRGSIGQRATLYRDTWRMAVERPVFGWGMASYPTVFYLYNTHEPNSYKWPNIYQDAHSDWLQSLAEHGFVGTSLLALLGIIPLSTLRRRHLRSPLPFYLFGGCAIVLAYAWVEFPFGNVCVVLTWWLCFFSAVRYARLEPETSERCSRS